MYATRARRARPEPFAVRPGIAERLGLPYMDAQLALAALGARRLRRLRARPGDAATTCPAAPATSSTARRSTRCSAWSACTLLARIDYSRFRELRVGIYTFLCASVSLVFVFGFAARGSRRAFDLPFFSFQPSELGKLLLVLALAGFVIEAPGGARRGSARCATSASASPRLRSFSCSRTSAPHWCTG